MARRDWLLGACERPGMVVWPTITETSTCSGIRMNGTRSRARSSSIGGPTASSTWVSPVERPCPGKCFSTGSTPASE